MDDTDDADVGGGDVDSEDEDDIYDDNRDYNNNGNDNERVGYIVTPNGPLTI